MRENTPTRTITSTLQLSVADSVKEGLRLLPKVDGPSVTDEVPLSLRKPIAAAITQLLAPLKKRASTPKHIR